jgi:hypothetical protein
MVREKRSEGEGSGILYFCSQGLNGRRVGIGREGVVSWSQEAMTWLSSCERERRKISSIAVP